MEGDSNTVTLGRRTVGEQDPPVIIAEIAQAHDGSLGAAHAYIDAVADAGVDAVKFQTHIASAESTFDEPFRIRFSEQDETRYAYWQRMEFTLAQWRSLKAHAESRGLVFLSSVFSLEAFEWMRELGQNTWKIASGEVFHEALLSAIVDTRQQVLLSTGLCQSQDLDQVLERIRRQCPLAIFQCTSEYPTPLSKVGLNVLEEYRERYQLPVGLSDHSGEIWPSVYAFAHGARLVEVHVTFHKKAFGPDVPASLDLDQLRQLVQARNAYHTLAQSHVNKADFGANTQHTKTIFGRSIGLKNDLPAGTRLTESHLIERKPGTGIPVHEKHRVLGKALKRAGNCAQLLKYEDLE